VSVAAKGTEVVVRNAGRRGVYLAKSMIEKFGKAAENAEKDKQHGAVLSALIAPAKLAGLWFDRTEVQNTNYAISDKPVTDPEWAAKHVTEN
jgi:hypothetical protein